ncbi:MAG TPA: glycine--tRNA ligase [Conexivisphaerales archaeon]|nr:glycine--tRNA ligase [Conexivisphaerales archaeon]
MSLPGKVDKALEIARRRGFFWPAYETYGGSAGLFVFGDNGVKMRENMASLWREMFVGPHGFLEIDGPEIVPEQVLQASGHVANFKDPMAECQSCHRKFRADHLLADAGVKMAEGAQPEVIEEKLLENNVKCPECGAQKWTVRPFLTMFQTGLGPYSEAVGYLRPETAQNIFVEFKRIFEAGRGKLPFGVAQVGRGFRNEISPRQSLVRMREFHMAEVELFFDPDDSECSFLKFVEDETLNLLTEDMVDQGKEEAMSESVKDALSKGHIKVAWLGYFMALSKLFLVRLGIPPEKQRFRAKLKGERAHYSAQTFDHEVLVEGWGWIEVAGHAYRTDYDLKSHMARTGADYSVSVEFDEPRRVTKTIWSLNVPAVKERYPGSWKEVLKAYGSLGPDAREAGVPEELGGEKLDPSVVQSSRKEEVVASKKLVPHVVEPSFGLDRIMLATMTNSLSRKEDRDVLGLPSRIAPVQVGVLPLLTKKEMTSEAEAIQATLEAAGLTTFYDDSGSIGRRYARLDEVGVPLAVTVDRDTLSKGTVTVRNRDTWEQTTVGKEDLPEALMRLLGSR